MTRVGTSNLLEVLGEIGLGEGLDAFVGVLEAGLHAPKPELIQRALGDLGPRPVGAVEQCRQVLVELRAVLRRGRSAGCRTPPSAGPPDWPRSSA